MTDTTIAIGIFGSAGRMGQALADAIPALGARIAGCTDAGDDAAALAAIADVLVDFSAPMALSPHLSAARLARTPILIGTTGLDGNHHAMIDEAASDIPVLQAANTSLGVNLLTAMVAQAAIRLGSEWDIEVLEMHHRHKVDAPSGTALLLGQAAANARGKSLPELTRFDRNDAREPGTIGFASLRGGSVVGDHTVIFASDGERIELGHRADNRTVFAHGAVRAALWLAGQPAGRYTMADMLGL
ncbi:MAG: 4-hydroxy-tetrahydrodipicolinate reductase [Sphingomonadaceae bacterium]